MSEKEFDLNQRPIPAAALRDPDSVEMLRVWIAEQKLHCSMKVGMYRDSMNIPEEIAWGTILADVARHVASAMSSMYGERGDECLVKIRDSFINEIGDPTSSTSGSFVERH